MLFIDSENDNSQLQFCKNDPIVCKKRNSMLTPKSFIYRKALTSNCIKLMLRIFESVL